MQTIISIPQSIMRDVKKKVLPFVSANPAISNLCKVLIQCHNSKVYFISADGFVVSK